MLVVDEPAPEPEPPLERNSGRVGALGAAGDLLGQSPQRPVGPQLRRVGGSRTGRRCWSSGQVSRTAPGRHPSRPRDTCARERRSGRGRSASTAPTAPESATASSSERDSCRLGAGDTEPRRCRSGRSRPGRSARCRTGPACWLRRGDGHAVPRPSRSGAADRDLSSCRAGMSPSSPSTEGSNPCRAGSSSSQRPPFTALRTVARQYCGVGPAVDPQDGHRLAAERQAVVLRVPDVADVDRLGGWS